MIVPALGNHIEIYKSDGLGITVYNNNTDKTYSLGEKEGRVLACLDGKRSISELHELCEFYSEDELKLLLNAFSELGLFEKHKTIINPLKIKIRLWNPNKIFERDAAITKCLFFIIFYVCPLLFAIGVAVSFYSRYLLSNQSDFNMNTVFSSLTVKSCVYIALGLFISLLLHEIAHATVARKYDVNVPEIGIMLYCLMPCAYTNVSGINLLKNNKQKIDVLIAGTLMNMGIIGALQIAARLSSSLQFNSVLSGIILANIMTIVMNTMIFLKFDGYYILEMLTEKPGLKDYSMQYLQVLVSGKKNQIQQINTIDSSDRVLYLIYGSASVMFVPIIMANTVIPIIQIWLR